MPLQLFYRNGRFHTPVQG